MRKSINGDYRQFLDKPYIGEWDLPDSEDLEVEISKVQVNTVKNEKGETEKLCVEFRGDLKPLIVNVTNGEAIKNALGTPKVEEWIGGELLLYRDRVSAFGKTTMAVRVRPYAPTKKIICELCGSVITAQKGKSPKQIAMTTKAKYGKSVCGDCAITLFEEKNKAEKEEVEAEAEQEDIASEDNED